MADFTETSKWAEAKRPLIVIEEQPRLLEDWPVCVEKVAAFVVPKDTLTDGASIPRFLWRICGHPLEVPRVYAAMAHDWLYSGATALTRKDADKCYYKLLRHFGISMWKAKIEYRAIRIFGGSHWEGNDK